MAGERHCDTCICGRRVLLIVDRFKFVARRRRNAARYREIRERYLLREHDFDPLTYRCQLCGASIDVPADDQCGGVPR